MHPVTPAPPPRTAAAAAFPWRRWGMALGRFLVCFGLLPNLPFWLVAQREGIATPGLINLDGLLLGVIALFVRPTWVIVAFAADFLLDIAYGIRATYGTAYIDILLSVRYLFSAVARSQLILIAGSSVLSVGLIALAWIYLRPRVQGRERTLLIIVIVALAVPWAVASRSQRLAATAQRKENAELGFVRSDNSKLTLAGFAATSTRSPALAFYHAWKREAMWAWLRGSDAQAVVPTASAASHAIPLLGPGPSHPNFVLVLVESWGDADATALRQSLLAPFAIQPITARYRASNGLVGFHGSTGDGELRELCNTRLAAADVPLAVSTEDLSRCLAWQLKREGYRTEALDSAAAFWPGGADWYKLLGFQQVIDYPAFQHLGLPTFVAGTFRSIRDQEAAGVIPHLLLADPGTPQFVFFLTVSAHLPIHLPLPADYTADCNIAPVTQHSPAACGWYKVEQQTLEAIAQAAATPNLPPTVFLVVGDHAPPFLDDSRRYFSATEVPYVLLAPR